MTVSQDAVIAAQHELIQSLKRENAELKRELERTSYHLEAARAERQDRDDEANALAIELEKTRDQLAAESADAVELEQIANDFARDKKVLYECWKQAEERYEQAKAIAADKITAYNIQRYIAQRHAARAAQAIAALEAIGFEFVAAAFVPTTPDSE